MVAVVLGWLLVGETLGRTQILALSVILVGVVLVNYSKEKKEKGSKPVTENAPLAKADVVQIPE